MSGLAEHSSTLIFASSSRLSHYDSSVEVHDENMASHRYIVGTENSILIVSSGNWGYSLILHQTRQVVGLLIVESKSISRDFFVPYQYLLGCLALWMNLFLLPCLVTWCIWSFGKYWPTELSELLRSSERWHVSLLKKTKPKNKPTQQLTSKRKSHFFMLPPNSSEKSFKCQEAFELTVTDPNFPKF